MGRRPIRRALAIVAVVGSIGGVLGAPAPAGAASSGTPILVWSRWPTPSSTRAELWGADPASISTTRHRIYVHSSRSVAFPQVTQDGTTAIFGLARGNDATFLSMIASVPVSGGSATRWTTPPSGYADVTPTWIPDGSGIVFARVHVATSRSQLYRLATPGGAPVAIPNTVNAFVPTISPDSYYVAFQRNRYVYSVHLADGADLFRMAPHRGCGWPRWSPRGDRLAFICDIGTSYTEMQWLTPADNSDGFSQPELWHRYPWTYIVGPASFRGEASDLMYYSLGVPNRAGDYAGNLYRHTYGAETATRLTSNTPTGAWESSPFHGGGAAPTWDESTWVDFQVESVTPRSVRLINTQIYNHNISHWVSCALPGADLPAQPCPTPGYEGIRQRHGLAGLTPDTDYTVMSYGVYWSGNATGVGADTIHTPKEASITIGRSAAKVRYPTSVRFTGMVTDTATLTPIEGATVILQTRLGAGAWTNLKSATSDASGNIAANYTPKWNRQYRWLLQNETYGPSYSSATAVRVVSVVRARLSRTTAPLGTTVKVYGTVSPPKTGSAVYLDRYVSGRWVRFRTGRLLAYTSTASKFSFSLRLPRGSYTLRVRKPSDAKNIGAVSPTVRLRVT